MTQLRISLSPVKMAISFSLSRFQARNVRSPELETARRPSGVTATAVTEAVWPRAGGSSGRSPGPRALVHGAVELGNQALSPTLRLLAFYGPLDPLGFAGR
jgi:hypothetical protein